VVYHLLIKIRPSKNVHYDTITAVTLALGLRPKQGLVRLRAKRKVGNERKCEGMNPLISKKLPLWELES
jgi:hypothetical protein